MLYSWTDPASYITEYTLVYEDNSILNPGDERWHRVQLAEETAKCNGSPSKCKPSSLGSRIFFTSVSHLLTESVAICKSHTADIKLAGLVPGKSLMSRGKIETVEHWGSSVGEGVEQMELSSFRGQLTLTF